jgi:hypothetical protein
MDQQQWENIFPFVSSIHPAARLVLMALGTLVVVGQLIVPLTKTKRDDEFLARVLSVPVLGTLVRALAAFAPVQPKQRRDTVQHETKQDKAA